MRPKGKRTENRAWPWLLLTHRFRVQSAQLWERNRAPSREGQQTVFEGMGHEAIHPETASSCGVTAWAGWTALLSHHTKTSCHIAVMAVSAPTSSLTKEEPIRALSSRYWQECEDFESLSSQSTRQTGQKLINQNSVKGDKVIMTSTQRQMKGLVAFGLNCLRCDLAFTQRK